MQLGEIGADPEDKHGLVRHLSLMRSFDGVQVRESCSAEQAVASTSPEGSREFRGSRS